MIALLILGGGLIAAGLAQVARGASDDVEALARVITSEAGGGSEAERTAIAWTVRNRARKRGVSIVALVCAPCGAQGPGRPFASAQDATASSLALARAVLAQPSSNDPTRGATAFFEPQLQDQLVAAGHAGYRSTATQVRAKWRGEGQAIIGTVGRFEFWA